MPEVLPNMFALSIYSFAVVGLFGVTLLPLRVVMAVRNAVHLRHESIVGKLGFYVVMALSLVALAIAAFQVAGVFRCLSGLHCSANRAGGLMFLAGVGVSYLMFEAFSVAILWVTRRVIRFAT
jgi:hypothetical protein